MDRDKKIMIITQEEFDKLKKELDQLNSKDRPKVAKDLKEAISQGDLSENAAYAEAKERQSQVETRIKQIENKLAMSEIRGSQREGSDSIGIGSSFRVLGEQTGQERAFSIVGPEVSNPTEGKISFDSPLGSAFLDKKQGDSVEVATPGGKKKYVILEIL